jgi:hypothetical protein
MESKNNERENDSCKFSITSQIASWVYTNPSSNKSQWSGRLGYLSGLLSSVFMIFLGKDFAEKLNIPPVLAYMLSTFSAVPLSLLLAKNTQTVISIQTAPADTKHNDLFKLIEKPQGFQTVKLISIKILFLGFALAPAIALAYLSHIKFLENTDNVGVSTFFDIPALIPRWILFHWAVKNAYQRLKKLVSHCIRSQTNYALIGNKILHLQKTDRVLDRLTDAEINQLNREIMEYDNEKKIESILELPKKHPELTKLNHWSTDAILNVLALLVGVCASSIMIPLGKKCYEGITDLLHTKSEGSMILGNIGAWIGAGTFTLLIYNAAVISFRRFYLTIMRLSRERLQNLARTNIQQHEQQTQLLPIQTETKSIVLIIFAAILAFISVFPRIEVNEEQLDQMAKFFRVMINIGSGIGYFSLDFWPLSDNLQKLNKINNTRMVLKSTVAKLMKGVGLFKEQVLDSMNWSFENSYSAKDDTDLITTPLLGQNNETKV